MESNNNQTFTKFPNELLERIMCSKLNATEIKILLCVVRYTYGFHRAQHELSQSFIQKATNISKRYLHDMIKSLLSKSILIETKKATPTTPRWLAINSDFDAISKLSSNNLDRYAELSTTSDADYSITGNAELSTQEKKTLNKNFKENLRVDNSVNEEDSKPLDMNTLKVQILVQYNAITKEDNTYSFKLEEVVDIFVFYYEEYRKHIGKDHPILSNESIKRIIKGLPSCIDTSGHGYIELISESYPDIIKKHFETSYQNCDYNILHFISGFIRAMRYYETTYE